MSRISIIIPIYNCAAFVGKTLDSLLTQTYRDIEIICVNDGSTDDSEKVLQQYAGRDGRIRVFNQPNAGVGKARNTGLDAATGTYIMFCDSDDWYEPNMCADMVTVLEQSRADVVMCQTCFEFESDSDRHIQSQKRGLTDRYYNPKKICDNLNKSRLSVNCLLWNKIWRKEIIDRYHIRFPEGCNHEDDAFWAIYSFCAEKILYLPQKLYHYFIRSGSIMDDYVNLKMKNRLDRMRSSHFVFDFLKTHNLLQRYSDDMCRIFYRQLKACLHFLTDDEVVEQITIVNQRLANDLHIPCFLTYYHHELFLFLKPKNPLILLAGLIWYGLRWCVSSPTRQHKYRRRLLKNMFYLTNPGGGGVMIYLNCEVKSGLGEDTFWTWFEREFPAVRLKNQPF